MTITNYELAKLAFIPGYAERFEAKANKIGDAAWAGVAKGVKVSRNILYAGLVLTVIGVAGSILSGSVAFKAAAFVGVGLAAFGGKKLYDATRKLENGWSNWVLRHGPFFDSAKVQ